MHASSTISFLKRSELESETWFSSPKSQEGKRRWETGTGKRACSSKNGLLQRWQSREISCIHTIGFSASLIFQSFTLFCLISSHFSVHTKMVWHSYQKWKLFFQSSFLYCNFLLDLKSWRTKIVFQVMMASLPLFLLLIISFLKQNWNSIFPLMISDCEAWKKNHGIELLLNWATCPTGIIISSSSNLPLNSSMSETSCIISQTWWRKWMVPKVPISMAIYAQHMQLKPPLSCYPSMKEHLTDFWPYLSPYLIIIKTPLDIKQKWW